MKKTNLRFVENEEMDIAEQKKSLRTFMRKRRADNENRDVKEVLMIDNLFHGVLDKMDGAGARRNVFVYLSYSSEAKTDSLINRLQEEGFNVYCPRLVEGKMFPVLCGEDFTISDYGIREPIGEVFLGAIDVVIVPLLAVDETGNRLGYGGGYYDKYFQEHTQALRVGFCYDFQVIKNVPHTDTDEKLDVIVTDKRVYFTNKRMNG